MAATLNKPPRGLAGYSDFSAWGMSLTDTLEHVPALHFPASIQVYAEMRRDPQLAAVLAGITLPIRRATWQVDPTGCRPEVVQLIADDLGLPIAGADTPGAARVRGVSWPEHLRQALLHLVYGFYTFELEADSSSGQARLTGLYERVPSTIAFIHATDKGDFGGISQILRPRGQGNEPEIGPERLVHYVHEREGASWHGTSLMRPGYSSWWIKQDLRRVLATSHRRFATGVPTVEWAPGFNPTPEAFQKAQQAASAIRVGETAGMTLPPGAHLVLTGLTGAVPDTIEALRWIDSQISGMVLSRWMDLGSSQTGSRALGEAFIDTFLLSLQSLADSIGDTATRQVAARVVAWNWGEDEPVPRIAAADVGTRHEVTADALNALMQSGALTSEPALEEWVRRTYHLPPRDPAYPWRPASDAPAAPALPPVKAARRRKPQTPGQLSLPIAAAAPDFGQLQTDWEQSRTDLLDRWPSDSTDLVETLAAAASAATAAGLFADLGDLTVDAGVVAALAALLATSMSSLAAPAATAAAAEAIAAGLPVTAPGLPGADRIGPLSDAYAAQLAAGYASAAGRKALTFAGPDVVQTDVEAAVRDHLVEMTASQSGFTADTFGAALSAAQLAGRRDVFAQFPDATFVAVEVNDTHQCPPCKAISGTEFPTLAAADAAYAAGGFVACLGGSRCRGTYTVKA